MFIRRLSTWILAASVSACATTRPLPLTGSAVVPAATGTVAAKKTRNGNTELTLQVNHLAQPRRLTPPAATYVVWTQALAGGRPQNVGALQVDADLSGRLVTTTPLENFRVFVTPEASPRAEQPSAFPVLSASIKQ